MLASNVRLVLFLLFCWLDLQFREMKNFVLLNLAYIVLYLQIFTDNYIFSQNLSLGFLKIFLKFCKYQPRYSCKIESVMGQLISLPKYTP